jgi:tryptophanyl-tRNA synthetase
LLYDTKIVPVGEDQRQHLELTRELARRFNGLYGKTLKVPESLIEKFGAKIMGLDDPTKKMSKSSGSRYNYISLIDEPDVIKDKIKKAVTDSDTLIKYDPNKKPGISNLLTILALSTNRDIREVEHKYFGENYGKLKIDTAQAVVNLISKFQEKFRKLSDSKVESILKKGALAAQKISQKKINEVYRKIGIR